MASDTNKNSPFTLEHAMPIYPQFGLFGLAGKSVRQWEYNGWKPESLSWKKTCYIHAGLSGPGQIIYKGPDVLKFLSQTFVNNFSKFKIGTAKHAIACEENGLIAGHGVLQRIGEEEFRLFVSGPWSLYAFSKFSGDVAQILENKFLFQVAGPTCLDALEKAIGHSLRDLAFMRFCEAEIAGKKVQVMRVGMAGSLAYELHGQMDDGPDVYDAVFNAGKQHGIERLGWQTFPVNHVEAGFPQLFWTFTSACYDHDGFARFNKEHAYMLPPPPNVVGSVDPANMRARFRTPHEVNWQRSIRFDHDFCGRDALLQEKQNPTKTIVTLEWDAEDVVDIYASLLRGGEEYKYLEIPGSPAHRAIHAHADHVLKDGKKIGYSSGTIYSYYYRKVISHCTLDIEQAKIGNELIILWGDFGGKMKEVRATVSRYPYLDIEKNQTINVKKSK